MKFRASIGLVVVGMLLLSAVILNPSAIKASIIQPVPYFTAHDPIRINGNGDFSIGVNGVVSGTGASDDPWIINDWDINGTGWGYGIYIGNTTDYAVIQNCTIHEATGNNSEYCWGAGVAFYYVQNGTVNNNTLNTNEQYGVYTTHSRFNSINNNTAVANQGGYISYWSDNNTLTNNTMQLNQIGIYVYGGFCYNISNNNCSSNSADGIRITSTNFAVVRNNNLYGNVNGLYLYQSHYNNLNNNTADYNQYGFKVSGIGLEYSSYNYIDNNTIYYNTVYGLYDIGPSNIIYKNNISYNPTGVYVSQGAIIINNSIYLNTNYGLRISATSTISYNIVSLTTSYGIYLESSGSSVYFNNITTNGIGVRITNTVTSNNIYFNNFINNTVQASDLNGNNYWNSSYPAGGNYWNDYTGVDLFAGVSQNISGSDGLGDWSYNFTTGNDFYPWMNPIDNVPHSQVQSITPYWNDGLVTVTSLAYLFFDTIQNVTLYYTFSSDNITWPGWWVDLGVDISDPWEWGFNWDNGSGWYRFYSLAYDSTGLLESPPGSYVYAGYDIVAPYSAVNATTNYWFNSTSTFGITVVDNTSGVYNVSLYYSYSAVNSSWGSWTLFGVDSAAPWNISFTFPAGQGYYKLYTRANDYVPLYETAPGTYDILCAYDSTAPTSSLNSTGIYWYTTTAMFNATANDTLSGLTNVTFWYNYSSDNVTWDGWAAFEKNESAPWTWVFDFPEGDGWYKLCSIANDTAINTESYPVSADITCGVDTETPWTDITAFTSYYTTTTPIYVNVTPFDNTSGIRNVTLFYQYSSDNGSWGGWVEYNTKPAAPWNWSFPLSSGNGWYRFFARSNDTAGQFENVAPYTIQEILYDNTTPVSSVDALGAYWFGISTVTLNATASDSGCGLANVTLYYQFSTNNASWGSWTFFETDVSAPWSWDFDFTIEGTGYYKFYSTAIDILGNIELYTTADIRAGCDLEQPCSQINNTNYWFTDIGTLTVVTYDNYSGIKDVCMFYKYAADNTTWGLWTAIDDTSAPWEFSFATLNGFYVIYTRANDSVGNREAIPDVSLYYGFDSKHPVSAIDVQPGFVNISDTINITTTALDTTSGLRNISLYYHYSVDNITWSNWELVSSDTSLPWEWEFDWTNGYGWYGFCSLAYDNATNIENGMLANDTVRRYEDMNPYSMVDVITPYWNAAGIPIDINITAYVNHTTIDSVDLYYQYSADNVSWGGWTSYATDAIPPVWSISFDFPDGDGSYQFYSISFDNDGHEESAPLAADAYDGADGGKPISALNSLAFYLYLSTPLQVTATASDNVSGLYELELWYRYSTDNTTFGAWTLFATNNGSTIYWNFSFPERAGYYELYSIAIDMASNYEDAPLVADIAIKYYVGYSNQTPGQSFSSNYFFEIAVAVGTIFLIIAILMIIRHLLKKGKDKNKGELL